MHLFLPFINKGLDVLEPQYRAYYLASDARQTSIAIAVWLIPVLLFAYSDYIILGLSPTFAASLILRLVFCVFSLYTISKLLKIATPRDYDQILLRWAIFATAVVLYCNYIWAPLVPPIGTITILIIFSAYMVFSTKLSIRLVPPLILSVGNLFLQWWIDKSASPYSLLTMLVAIVMANVLGIIFSSFFQKHRYTEFKSRQEETRIKEDFIRLASIDDLTGVFNRRKLIQLATEEFERSKNSSEFFSVLMIDIDHFKKLNDNYGHKAGDLTLAKFAAYVTDNLNVKNIWGRIGGEEFVLVLPGLPGKQAKPIADQLRLGLNVNPVNWQGELLTYTISIGITERQKHDQSFDDVLRRADKALYHAKQNGRNRTEVL